MAGRQAAVPVPLALVPLTVHLAWRLAAPSGGATPRAFNQLGALTHVTRHHLWRRMAKPIAVTRLHQHDTGLQGLQKGQEATALVTRKIGMKNPDYTANEQEFMEWSQGQAESAKIDLVGMAKAKLKEMGVAE